MKGGLIFTLLVLLIIGSSCSDTLELNPVSNIDVDLTNIPHNPTLKEIEKPINFPIFEQPSDNLMTEEGVELGRHLFYDPILSRDSLMSCNGCHFPRSSFTDNLAFSKGVDGIEGSRSSMSLLNVGFYYDGFFWDGRVNTLEEQAVLPIEDPIELHTMWPEVIEKIQRLPRYQEMYREAFDITNANQITRDLTVKAIAQFERSMVSSGQSKYDLEQAGRYVYTDEELMGFEIFFDTNVDLPDGQCFHCHAAPLLTTNEYLNNGLTEAEEWDDFPDLGLGGFTGNDLDKGKFRTPTLRNIEFTAPYMHDGRFETLEEVMEHYNSGGAISKGKSPLMDSIALNPIQTAAVIAFMKTLSDEDFNNNPAFSNPY
jgi:cytochrome c peroxidase